jgi:hypothetical protein
MGHHRSKMRAVGIIPFHYHDGMLLEPIDYLVLLIGTLMSTGWGFVLLGLS